MEDKKQDSIALWKNQKRRNDRDPAYTGRGTVGGKNVQAAAWINTEKKNENSPDFTVRLSEPTTKPKSEEIPF